MKNKILVLAAVLGLLASNCKNNETREMDSTGAAADTVSAVQPSDASSDDGHGELMAAMNNMMEKIHGLEKKGISDYDLAAEMKEHHKGAIAMAEAELDSGTDAGLRQMAQKIKDAQQKEVGELDAMLAQFDDKAKDYDPLNTDAGLGKAMSENMQAMMKIPEMEQTSVDKSFAAMMVKHHQDGIKMGKAILEFAKDAKFKTMTQKMINDQEKEISELQQWQAQHR